MAWSTQQLADLAGTTVKAIRYYHQLGLLDLPERRSNGYKQYEVGHLVRLLQIRRLSELGVPLADVAAMGRADQDPDEALRVLDAELEATVNRLNRIRAELAVIMKHRAPAYVPPEFAPISRELSDRQRSLLMVYSTVLSDESKEKLRDLVSQPDDGTQADFEALPEDADDATIERLATRLLPIVIKSRAGNPWAKDPVADSPHGARRAGDAMAQAMIDLYHPAQLRVLKRLNELLQEHDA
ncbi:helix-turn-helix domain-containing protein [Microlunatus parietis]|uniref:DNA-binding transcriptional MerR regulator n=1 Tax=Microlunatus parietis TaxID=682979 RepID=A0A7Y9LD51_9ACTN|nr:MerR family transcriptional regulator [Microlunatus parietis]NYE71566.1 DNA-binding transcriptional MerR regulator [Microlunatus parietis]